MPPLKFSLLDGSQIPQKLNDLSIPYKTQTLYNGQTFIIVEKVNDQEISRKLQLYNI